MKEFYKQQNINDIQKIAQKIATSLKIGDVLLLNGDLGAGKTTFTRFLVSFLGGKNIRVSSPTFTIMQIYKGDELKFPIYHFDAYRLEGIGGMDQGYEDYIYGDGISIIEWGEFIKDILPDKYISITFKRSEQNTEQDLEEFRDVEIEINNLN
ncbi:MAG: tRNA (adenosine(37)-N6)-threonylcarbamoyltransferase complex ATPase subunit type 1 TsaE [Lactobacillaceae bacterium]|jgi:tRNA threonylcarbamoyladenosine biosynthesis protein TsaE|nr:tRNA (adenosine(37)-N6)-threonylcarbamoyltransferase complex ATPase subunit type 1 TsaE [Lactobacillaceae bacterium]